MYAVKERVGLLCLSESLCKYLPSCQNDPGLSLTFAAYFLVPFYGSVCCYYVAIL